MRLRTGRHLDGASTPAVTVYIQRGGEPGDDDEWVGVLWDPARAREIIAIVNGERPPLPSTPGGPGS